MDAGQFKYCKFKLYQYIQLFCGQFMSDSVVNTYTFSCLSLYVVLLVVLLVHIDLSSCSLVIDNVKGCHWRHSAFDSEISILA